METLNQLHFLKSGLPTVAFAISKIVLQDKVDMMKVYAKRGHIGLPAKLHNSDLRQNSAEIRQKLESRILAGSFLITMAKFNLERSWHHISETVESFTKNFRKKVP